MLEYVSSFHLLNNIINIFLLSSCFCLWGKYFSKYCLLMIMKSFARFVAGVLASHNNLFFLHLKLFLYTPMCRLFCRLCHQDRFPSDVFFIIGNDVLLTLLFCLDFLFLNAANFTASCCVYSKASN